MKLTIPDLINLIILFSSSFFGIYRGFIYSVISLISFISSFVLAYSAHPHIQEITQKYIINETAQNIVAVVMSYIISFMLVSFSKSHVIKLTDTVSHGFIDRIFGLGFGIVRGAMYSLSIFYIVIIFNQPQLLNNKHIADLATAFKKCDYPKWFKDSETAVAVQQVNNLFVSILPHEILYYDLSKTPIEFISNNLLKAKKVKLPVNKLDDDMLKSEDFLDDESLDNM